MGPRETEISILLLSETPMARLNERYREKRGVTDVLSFPLEEGLAGALAKTPRVPWTRHRARLASEIGRRARARPGEPLALGDIALCHPIAKAQARELGETLDQAYARLLAHALAHLLGYDHERGRAWEKAMAVVERGLRAAKTP